MTGAQLVPRSDERQFEKLWIFLDFGDELRVGRAYVLQPCIDVGLGFCVYESCEGKALDKAADFAGGHRLLLQIDKVDRYTTFFEEALGGARRLRIFHAKDLNARHRFILHDGHLIRTRNRAIG